MSGETENEDYESGYEAGSEAGYERCAEERESALAAANQRAEAAEAECKRLREAIRLARRRDYGGGPCWCMAADA